MHHNILPMFNYTIPVVYTTEISAHYRKSYYSIDVSTIGNYLDYNFPKLSKTIMIFGEKKLSV